MNSEIEDIYPLSPMQEGILLHSLRYPDKGIYVTQLCAEIEGELNEEAFERAWQRVIEQQSVLRTSFEWEEVSTPLQIVERHVSPEWEKQDWRGKNDEQQQQQLEDYLIADRARGFDLARAPLMRMGLMRTSESSYQMIWTHHHLLMDGWSVPMVLGQVLSFYEAYTGARKEEVRAARPYSDYIRWLQQQDLSGAEQYWRRLLEGFSKPTRIGVKRTRRLEGEGYGRKVERISRVKSREIEEEAGRQRVTVNTMVQGGWAIVLMRYSGESDVVYGATTAGRPAEMEGVERMVGLFINTLPVRVKVEGTERVDEYLKEVQRQQVEGRKYEYSPLMKIQGWSEVGRGEALFESIVVFENYPIDKEPQQQPGGLRVVQSRTEEGNNYPLTAVAVPGEEMVLHIAYDAELYEAEAIERMMRHWRRLVEEMAADPHRKISELSILDEAEQRQLLVEWNDTKRTYPAKKRIK
jgi:hypothetical protein